MVVRFDSLAIPGIGAFIAAGLIKGCIERWAAGAASDGLAGSLIGRAIPEYEAKRYVRKNQERKCLDLEHAASSEAIDKSKEIFEQAHAEDIPSTEETSLST